MGAVMDRRRRAAELTRELTKCAAQLRRRVVLSNRDTVRQRRRGDAILVRQLEEDRRLEHLFGIRRREYFSRLIPIHNHAHLLLRVTESAAERHGSLRAA